MFKSVFLEIRSPIELGQSIRISNLRPKRCYAANRKVNRACILAICRVSMQTLHRRCTRIAAPREPQTGRCGARTVLLKTRWRATRDSQAQTAGSRASWCSSPFLPRMERLETRRSIGRLHMGGRPAGAASATCSSTGSRTRTSRADGVPGTTVPMNQGEALAPVDLQKRGEQDPFAHSLEGEHQHRLPLTPSPVRSHGHRRDRQGAARQTSHHGRRPLGFKVRPRA